MKTGLETLGFFVRVSQSFVRESADPVVLFGTSAFKNIERAEGGWLMVDRACWGDPDCVRLGWNGRGLHAEYFVPFEKDGREPPKREKHTPGDRVILCGDYGSAPYAPTATHFKPHPAQPDFNPTGLPVVQDFEDCRRAIVGSSTVAVDLQLKGIPVEITDRANMANQSLGWLAWTQWSWDEIEQGEPIRHLFEWLK